MKLRPRAECLIFKDSKVLACLDKGYVCFPGGGIDPGESAVQAAKRECLEEADRVLITCTPAHPPTVQVWSKAYKDKKMAWTEGFDGGLTHWMTGSSSWKPFHADPRMRHEDYENFQWHSIDDLLDKLAEEAAGDWGDDVKVRTEVLRAYQKMHEPTKAALYPVLSAGNPAHTVTSC